MIDVNHRDKQFNNFDWTLQTVWTRKVNKSQRKFCNIERQKTNHNVAYGRKFNDKILTFNEKLISSIVKVSTLLLCESILYGTLR